MVYSETVGWFHLIDPDLILQILRQIYDIWSNSV